MFRLVSCLCPHLVFVRTLLCVLSCCPDPVYPLSCSFAGPLARAVFARVCPVNIIVVVPETRPRAASKLFVTPPIVLSSLPLFPPDHGLGRSRQRVLQQHGCVYLGHEPPGPPR